jgi:hypothetical protein
MKTPEALNTKHIDILLSFPTNICVPCSDRQSNIYDCCKEARGEILDGDLETD